MSGPCFHWNCLENMEKNWSLSEEHITTSGLYAPSEKIRIKSWCSSSYPSKASCPCSAQFEKCESERIVLREAEAAQQDLVQVPKVSVGRQFTSGVGPSGDDTDNSLQQVSGQHGYAKLDGNASAWS